MYWAFATSQFIVKPWVWLILHQVQNDLFPSHIPSPPFWYVAALTTLYLVLNTYLNLNLLLPTLSFLPVHLPDLSYTHTHTTPHPLGPFTASTHLIICEHPHPTSSSFSQNSSPMLEPCSPVLSEGGFWSHQRSVAFFLIPLRHHSWRRDWQLLATSFCF
jgi:hypothetical protein